jgi:hypothetical protein
VSAQAGWYPDPGGGANLFRYWDGKAWSAATTYNPQAAPPSVGLVDVGQPGQPTQAGQPGQPGQPSQPGQPYGQYGGQAGQPPYAQAGAGAGAYANYQAAQKRRSPVGWWIAAAALVVVIIVVAVIAVRAISGGAGVTGGPVGNQPSQDACPKVDSSAPQSQRPDPNDGRVHGGPISYPKLGSPWSDPQTDFRVPFGSDVQSQLVDVEPNYQPGSNWVASILVGELQAGDGFFTPEQGSQIVVKCILGEFYGDNEVQSNVTVNKGTRIDGNEAWLVESKLTFDIEGLETKGELLIVAIVATGSTAGLYYASIPDTRPELVKPARDSLAALTVDA